MKKFFYIAFLAIICWSCNKNEVSEPKQEYQEGQKVTIKVAARGQHYDVQSRKVIGTWKDADYVDFVWEWQSDIKEQIKIVYNGKSAIFDCIENDQTSATFEGVMPGGWQPGEEAKVYAGDIELDDHDWPISNQGQIKLDGIKSNMMRFEGTLTDLEETVELTAIWSAFRFPIYFNAKHVDWEKGTNLPVDTKVKFWTNSLVLTANCDGDPVEYHYTIEGGHNYSISESGSGAGSSAYIYYIFVVKPGGYTNVNIDVTFDLITTDKKKFNVYWFNEDEGDAVYYTLNPTDQLATKTLHANEIEDELVAGNIYTPSPLEFVYTFKEKEE